MNLWVGIFHSRLSFMWIVLWYCLLPIHLPLININSTAPHSHAHTAHRPVYAYEKVWKGEDRIRLKSYTGKCANHKRKCTCMCSEAKRAKETWCLTWILNVCCVKCSLFVCTKPHNYVLWKRSIEYRRYIARILYEGALCVLYLSTQQKPKRSISHRACTHKSAVAITRDATRWCVWKILIHCLLQRY